MATLDCKFELGGAVGASTVYTTITSGTANTKGSYTELIASTSLDSHSIIVMVSENPSTNIESFLIDIAVGAGGSEQIIISNLQYNQRSLYGEEVLLQLRLPFPVPAATRISARCQSATASATVRVAVMLIAGYCDETIGLCTTYGDLTATSNGTSVDAGGTANTKGSWSELTSSTSIDHKGFFVTIGPIAGGAQDAGFLLDIGVGAAASEQVIVPDLHSWVETDGALISTNVYGPFWMPIPSGTRIAARCQCTTNSATYRILRVTLTGVS